MKPSIWTGMYAEKSLAEATEILCECGWRIFEISDEHLRQIENDSDQENQIREMVEKARVLDVAMLQSHALLGADIAHADSAQRKRDIERIKRHCDISAQLGVKCVVVHPGRGEGATTRAEYKALIERNKSVFQELGDYGGRQQLKICIENIMDRHDAAGARTFGTASHELLDLLDELDHPALGLTLDTSHANVQKLDIPALIHEWDDRLLATHISDNDGSGDQHRMPGEGTICWSSVMAAFDDIGYRGLFNLEIPGERHEDPAVRTRQSRRAQEIAEQMAGHTHKEYSQCN